MFPIPDSRFPIPDSRFPNPESRIPNPESRNAVLHFLSLGAERSRFPKHNVSICRCLFDHLTYRFQQFCDLTRLWGDNSIQSALGADWVVAALLMSFGRLTSKSLWETDVDVLRETDKGEESPGFIEQGAR